MRKSKKELREFFKDKRKEVQISTKLLWDLVESGTFDFEGKLIEIYLSFEHEIDTFEFINLLRKKGATICSPVVNPDHLTLSSLVWYDLEQLVDNKWGIPEPINGQKIDKSEIDIVFVPLLVADKKGMRVGYGKGYYDRHLPECTNAKFIGLSQFDLITEITDINEFDIPMHYCLCPNGLYAF